MRVFFWETYYAQLAGQRTKRTCERPCVFSLPCHYYVQESVFFFFFPLPFFSGHIFVQSLLPPSSIVVAVVVVILLLLFLLFFACKTKSPKVLELLDPSLVPLVVSKCPRKQVSINFCKETRTGSVQLFVFSYTLRYIL